MKILLLRHVLMALWKHPFLLHKWLQVHVLAINENYILSLNSQNSVNTFRKNTLSYILS